jgi:hypothetical protein
MSATFPKPVAKIIPFNSLVLFAILSSNSPPKCRSFLDKKDRKMFDQMYDCVKLHNSACMMACRPVHAVLEELSRYSI